jgi:actin-like ATPase involved in cell morphogenesis
LVAEFARIQPAWLNSGEFSYQFSRDSTEEIGMPDADAKQAPQPGAMAVSLLPLIPVRELDDQPAAGRQTVTTECAIGIDFGTAASSVACLIGVTGNVEPLTDREGGVRTPSVVWFGAKTTLVGAAARRIAEEADGQDAVRCVSGFKDGLAQAGYLPVPDRKVTAIEATAELLRAIKADVDVGGPQKRAVVSHPSHFGPAEQQLLSDATKLAGFEEVGLVEDPVAAALAYDRDCGGDGDVILVCDAGAGRFAIAVVIRTEDGSFRRFLPPRSLPIGGNAFDQLIYDYLDAEIRKTGKLMVPEGRPRPAALLANCRLQKEELSFRERSSRKWRLSDGKAFDSELTSTVFEGLISCHVQALARLAREALDEAGTHGHAVETVLLTGGSSRIPLLRKLITEALPIAPTRWRQADTAVARGAAIASGLLFNVGTGSRPTTTRVRIEKTTTLAELVYRLEKRLEEEEEQMEADALRRDAESQKRALDFFAAKAARIDADRQQLRPLLAQQLANRQFADAQQTVSALLSTNPDDAEVLKAQALLDARLPTIGELKTIGVSTQVRGITICTDPPELEALLGAANGRIFCDVSASQITSWGGSGSSYACWAVAYDPDNDRIVTGGDNGTIQVWSDDDYTETASWSNGSPVRRICILGDGAQIATSSGDGKVRIWDIARKEVVATFEGHSGYVAALDASEDGEFIVSGGDDGTLRLWDLKRGRAARKLGTHRGGVNDAAFFPGSNRIVVSCGADGALRLWDTSSGRPMGIWEGHEGWVRRVVFTPDGRHAVSCGQDKTVRVWDVVSGWELRKFTGHTNDVMALAITDDGTQAITGGYDNTVRLWHLGL